MAGRSDYSFRAMAEAYLRDLEARGAAPATIRKKESLLRILIPRLARTQLLDIHPARLKWALRWKMKRGKRDTVQDAVALTNAIIRYAIEVNDWAWESRCATMRYALPKPKRPGVRSIGSATELGRLLRGIECYPGHDVVRVGLLLLAHTLVEPRHLRFAKWEAVDIDGGLLKLPERGEKPSRFVMLSDRAASLFRELDSDRKPDAWVLPSPIRRGQPISDMAFINALRRLAGNDRPFTSGSFRKTARELLKERGYSTAKTDRLLTLTELEMRAPPTPDGDLPNDVFVLAQSWSKHLEKLSSASASDI